MGGGLKGASCSPELSHDEGRSFSYGMGRVLTPSTSLRPAFAKHSRKAGMNGGRKGECRKKERGSTLTSNVRTRARELGGGIVAVLLGICVRASAYNPGATDDFGLGVMWQRASFILLQAELRCPLRHHMRIGVAFFFLCRQSIEEI